MDDMGSWSFWVLSLPTCSSQPRTEVAQVYSIARASTLLSVILNMIGMDNTIPLDCQASPVAYVWPVILSDNYVPKGLDHFPSREPHLFISRNTRQIHQSIFFFLVIFLPRLCYLFVVDCASYVRIPLTMIVLPNQGAQGSLAESPFGTGRRLFWLPQWACG